MPLLRSLAVCLLTPALLAQTNAARNVDRAADLVREQDIRADIFFLASDAMAGRNSTSHEDRIAVDYIAAEFMRLGLKPVGDGGTYLQQMEIVTGELDREHTSMSATIAGEQKVFRYGTDFTLARQSIRNTSSCGPVVFAGYGIDAPEYGYNDFTGIDVKGKIAMIFLREPQANDPASKMMGTLDTWHGFNWQKLEELRRRGAAGLILVQDRVPRDVKPIPPTSPRPAVTTSYALAGQMWDIPTFLVKRDLVDQLLAPANKHTDALQAEIDSGFSPQSFDLPQTNVCLNKAYTEITPHQGINVVGLLEGSDPKLKAETVILTAHHDHMGTSGGHIYHGADDNASGVAGMLAVARGLVHSNVRPKRSVLFIGYDAEERIFLGSYFYVTHPLVPLDKTIATINLDMIGRNENDANWPVPADKNRNMVNVLGTRYNPGIRTILDSEDAHEQLKLDYKMDRVDPDSLWSRSDHFWFATMRIPQVEFQTGLHPDYHTENDSWERINYPKTTHIARLVLRAIVDLADAPKPVAFVPAGTPLPGPAK